MSLSRLELSKAPPNSCLKNEFEPIIALDMLPVWEYDDFMDKLEDKLNRLKKAYKSYCRIMTKYEAYVLTLYFDGYSIYRIAKTIDVHPMVIYRIVNRLLDKDAI